MCGFGVVAGVRVLGKLPFGGVWGVGFACEVGFVWFYCGMGA